MKLINFEAKKIQRALGLDPAAIALIIEAIMAAIKALQDCRAKRSSWAAIKNEARLANGYTRLRHRVTRRIGREALAGLGGRAFLQQLIDRLRAKSASELEAVCAEVVN